MAAQFSSYCENSVRDTGIKDLLSQLSTLNSQDSSILQVLLTAALEDNITAYIERSEYDVCLSVL